MNSASNLKVNCAVAIKIFATIKHRIYSRRCHYYRPVDYRKNSRRYHYYRPVDSILICINCFVRISTHNSICVPFKGFHGISFVLAKPVMSERILLLCDQFLIDTLHLGIKKEVCGNKGTNLRSGCFVWEIFSTKQFQQSLHAALVFKVFLLCMVFDSNESNSKQFQKPTCSLGQFKNFS